MEQFLDELIKRAEAQGYSPTTFMRMRDHGAIAAIRRLVETGQPQSGFRRLQKLGLTDWCLESAVIRFAEKFPAKTVAYACARLDGVFDA